MSLFYEDDYGDMYDYIPGEFVYGDNIHVPEEYMEEKWWYINGFPNYMVSNCGRVWSEKTQRFLKPKRANKHGHLMVSLCNGGDVYYRLIHRLVAEAFLDNPYNFPVVRHLDDDPTNNSVYNLAWGTQKENFHDCIENGKANCVRLETPIIAVDVYNGVKLYFKSQAEAGRKLNIQQANIWKVLHGERYTAGGYHFKYVEEGKYE